MSDHAVQSDPSGKAKGMLQAVKSLLPQALHAEHRNAGTALKPEWFETVHVNLSAVERRTGALGARRSVKKEWQAAWLVKALTCIDLTTLAGDDTPGCVGRLCAKARKPLRALAQSHFAMA